MDAAAEEMCEKLCDALLRIQAVLERLETIELKRLAAEKAK